MLLAAAALLTAVACASGTKTVAGRNAQLLAPPSDACELARQDAALDPRLDVEKVPAPLAMNPAPIRQPVPRSVLGRNRRSVIRVEVMVDTLGQPDMTTFNVIESSHEWFTTGARRAIAKWKFSPAERNGCKVGRYYQFSASSGGSGR